MHAIVVSCVYMHSLNTQTEQSYSHLNTQVCVVVDKMEKMPRDKVGRVFA